MRFKNKILILLLIIFISKIVWAEDNKNVIFIGGSITAGSKASNIHSSWAYLTYEWLKNSSHNNLSYKNIAIGGTTSRYAVYRLERDLGKIKPDIAFIEFAMNDPVNKSFVDLFIGTLIDKLRIINNDIEIYYVATTGGRYVNQLSENKTPNSTHFAKEISKNKNIKFIDAGKFLWNYAASHNNKTLKNYLPDNIHPNDLGHKIYFYAVKNKIIQIENNGEKTKKNVRVISKNKNYYVGANIFPVDIVNDDSSCIIKNNTLVCHGNDNFSVDFFGKAIGVESKISHDGGRLICNIDSDLNVKYDMWDKYALKFDRWNGFVFSDKLERKHHKLECKVSNTIIKNKYGSSKGSNVYIRGFLMIDS